jgi:probable phosphoglycerate mutase
LIRYKINEKHMTEILLIRHGETDWNAERRLQGHLDIPLNAEGLWQAEALGRSLLSEPLDAIIASDLQRARQTAHAIAAPRGMTVLIDPGLRERCFGAFEGLRYDEIGAVYPEAYAAWRARDLDARYPRGVHVAETMREFFERAVGAITRLVSSNCYRKIAIVTHGGVLECAYRAAHGVGLAHARDFDVLNASINRLLWDGTGMRVTDWADVAHLDDSVLDEIDR